MHTGRWIPPKVSKNMHPGPVHSFKNKFITVTETILQE